MTKPHTYNKLQRTKFISEHSDLWNSEVNILDRDYGDRPGILFDQSIGLVILVNHAFLEFTGYQETELLGRHLSMIFPDIVADSIRFGDQITQEIVLANKDSKIIMVRASNITSDDKTILLKIFPLSTALKSGSELGHSRFDYMIHLSELSKTKTLDLALQQSIPILRNLFGTKRVNIYWLDNESMVFRKRYGYDPQKQMPRQIPNSDMLMLSKPMVWRNNQIPRTLKDNSEESGELKYFISVPLGVGNGVVGLILAGGSSEAPPRGSDKIMEFVRVNFNATISHFTLTENLLFTVNKKEVEIRYQDYLINNLKDGILILSPDLSIQKVNQASELLLGYSASEILSKSVEDVLIGPSILLTSLLEAQNGVPSHTLGDIQIHHRSGYPFPVKMQILPISEGETLINIIVLISDVSEYEQITLRTQQLENRAILGEFISAFAHDVRNPINNISTSLQLLTRKIPENDPAQEIIGRLDEDCDRLTHLMESFLSYSRLVDNSRFELIDVAALMNRLVSKWKPTMDNYGIKPHISISKNLPKIFADQRSLERVFINLLSNAIDAMKEGVANPVLGVVLTKTSMVDLGKPQVRISISDNGIGIPDDMKERIFEPFVTTKADGTGLGLAISKQIITAHKGTITVKSFLGGTVFNILLPILERVEDESDNTGD